MITSHCRASSSVALAGEQEELRLKRLQREIGVPNTHFLTHPMQEEQLWYPMTLRACTRRKTLAEVEGWVID